MNCVRFRVPKLRVAGVLRVLALLVAVQLAAGALWLQSAHARASEALLSVGAELMKLEGVNSDRPARSIFVNGITVHLRTGTTDRDLHAVLDRFHALCRTRTGVEAPQEVLNKLSGDADKRMPSTAFDGVLRAESESSGAVACIDTGMQLSVAELTSRLQEFAKTGDLSAIGELRYVLARRLAGRTAVLAMWTDGPAPLLKMFPSVGDAPGQDPSGVPRAPGLRRLLSTWENGQPYSLAIYTAAGAELETLGTFYADSLRRGGWNVGPTETVHQPSPRSLIARRGSQTILVRVAEDRHGQSSVSVVALGSG
jgi:hypothetical protein